MQGWEPASEGNAEAAAVPKEEQRLLQASIVGVPNSGKSTLINALVGTKVSPFCSLIYRGNMKCRARGTMLEGVQTVITGVLNCIQSLRCLCTKLSVFGF